MFSGAMVTEVLKKMEVHRESNRLGLVSSSVWLAPVIDALKAAWAEVGTGFWARSILPLFANERGNRGVCMPLQSGYV